MKRLASNPGQHVAELDAQLATLLKAGVPLSESLQLGLVGGLLEETKRAFEKVAERVREGIWFRPRARRPQGVLRAALHQHGVRGRGLGKPRRRAGAPRGLLGGAAQASRSRITGALAYPAFMAVFGVVMVA